MVTNSLHVENRTRVSGSIAATTAATGAVLTSSAEARLGVDAVVDGDIRADTLVLDSGARIFGQAASNLISGTGTPDSTRAPLTTPLSVPLPTLPSIVHGQTNIEVTANQTRVLNPGSYRDLSVLSGNGGGKTKLQLTGGNYTFRAVNLGNDTRLECLAACEVRVKNQLKVGARSFWGPTGAGMLPKDATIYVAGSNVGAGLKVAPHAGYIENDTELKAFALVPNGTLRLGHRVKFGGKIVARDAWLEMDVNADITRPKASWDEPAVRLDASVKYDIDSRYDEHGNQLPGPPSSTAHLGSAFPGAPVAFNIPDHLPVTSGNAGNGEATLGFVNPIGVAVTCTYRGGASVLHPTEELDRMKGLRYVFESCSNGQEANDPAEGSSFTLTVVSGDSNLPYGETAVALNLGPGCHDTLEAAMSGADVVALKESFDWANATNLNEVDPDGHHAVWHGLIYIERKEQIAALDRWRILWSAHPLSREYRTKHDGKCGRVEHATDGKGVVIYAVFPAKFYNLMRSFALDAAAANVAPPFRFVIPSTPDEPDFVNSDGSLNYEALAAANFQRWLEDRSQLQPGWFDDFTSWAAGAAVDAYEWVTGAAGTAVDGVETGFAYASASWDEIVDFSANAIDDGWELVQMGMQSLNLLFNDEIRVRMNIKVTELDPHIGLGTLRRMWGPTDPAGNRPELFPVGARVRVRQFLRSGIIPSMGEDKINSNGRVNIRAIKGFGTYEEKDICIELDTDYAEISTDLIPNEVCNFNNGLVDFTQTVDVDMPIAHPDVYTLTQFKDSFDYSKTVIGHEPEMFQVLTGWGANNLTSLIAGSERAMALCLDFPGTSSSAITSALMSVGAVGELWAGLLAGSPFYMKDLWLPDTDAKRSRGVPTHEYGHFELCSLVYAEEGAEALTGLMARMSEREERRDHTMGQVLETFADEFAMQVMGGWNYSTIDQSRVTSTMKICTGSPCADVNRNGQSDHPYRFSFGPTDANGEHPQIQVDWRDELARWQTLVRDAFDTHDGATRGTLHPGNSDYWFEPGGCAPPIVNAANQLECATPGCILETRMTVVSVSPLDLDPLGRCVRPMIAASSSFIANDDERVNLPGSAWREWVNRYLDRSRGSLSDKPLEYAPTARAVIGGLADVMKAHHNWCDACEVVAMHSGAVSSSARMSMDPVFTPVQNGPRTFQLQFERYKACVTDGQLQDFMGPAPDAALNLDSSCEACPPLHFVDLQTGACTACPTGQVPIPMGGTDNGLRCRACNVGEVTGPDNSCHPCADNELALGQTCVACPVHQVANADHTVCIGCPVDETVDWAPIGAKECRRATSIDFNPNVDTSDICPDVHVVKLENLDAEATSGITWSFGGASGVLPNCEQLQGSVTVYSSDSAGALTQVAPTTWSDGYERGELICAICGDCLLSFDGSIPGTEVQSAGNELTFAVEMPMALGFGMLTVSSNRSGSCGPGPF